MTVASGVGQAMAALVRVSVRRPLVTVLVSVLLAGCGVAYTLHRLTFVTSAIRLLPQRARYVVQLRQYQRDFGELNDIVVAIEAPRPDVARRYAARLATDLRAGLPGTPRLTYRVDPGYFTGRGLLYLSVDELTRLRDRLFDSQEFLESYAARPSLAQLIDGIGTQIANGIALGFMDLGVAGSREEDLSFVQGVLEQIQEASAGGASYRSPWGTAFSVSRVDDPDAGFFFSSDKKLLFLFVQAQRREGDFTDNRALIDQIRATVARLGPDFPDVQAGVTGAPAISNDEMHTAFADSKVATVLAFAATLALLLVAFRRAAAPLLMLVTLVVSLAWSIGIITLVIGHLTIFSVMFISIVVGIGIDYGIYFLYRYDEELWLGATRATALDRTAERTGPGMLLGALTAAGTFFVLMLTTFQGIREFGFVAGTAILAAFVSMLTLFPAFLVLADRGQRRPSEPPEAELAAPAARGLERLTAHRKLILTGSVVLTILSIPGTVHVDFDSNMLRLQARGVESVVWEERILQSAGRSGYTALATAATLEELAQRQAAFAALPSVSKVESVLMIVPERQDDKIVLIRQFAPLVRPIHVAAPPGEFDPAELTQPLTTLRRRLGLIVEGAADKPAGAQARAAMATVDTVMPRLTGADAVRVAPALARLQRRIALDFTDKLTTFQKNLDPRPVTAAGVPPDLRQRYVGTSGRFLMRIHPAIDIWEPAESERFVRDLRGVDPDVTGPPVTAYEATQLIRRGYVEGTVYALLLVMLISALLLRSAVGAGLALAPLVLGVLWTLGLMDAFDLKFNLANVWALPLIIGTAAEYGLNIFVRFLEGRQTGGPLLARSTVMAVVLNGLTVISGFGSLMVAHHQGIFGLGLLLTIGAATSLLSSLVVLPVLIRLFLSRSTVQPDAITTFASR